MKTVSLPLALSLLFILSDCTPSLKRALARESSEAYVGTYTRDEGWVNGQAAGVYRLRFDGAGRVTEQDLVADLINPSFLVEGRRGRYLYVVSELARADEPTGYLHLLDTQEGFRGVAKLPTGGQAPCHVELDDRNDFVVVSNYVGGNARVFRRGSGGRLTVTDTFDAKQANGGRGTPHVHAAKFSPGEGLLALADLGLDRVWLFRLDRAEGRLIPAPTPFVQLAAGAGPRHLAWSERHPLLYVINELNSTVSVLRRDSTDRLTEVQTVGTLPPDYTGENACADLHLHPNGRFLYGSNRGHNSLVIFAVDEQTGRLTTIGHHPTGGEVPRNFAISPDGRRVYVANQNSNNITLHSLDWRTGRLVAAGPAGEIAIPTPVCVEF